MQVSNEREREIILSTAYERMQEIVRSVDYDVQEKRIRAQVQLEYTFERLAPFLSLTERELIEGILAWNKRLWSAPASES